MKNVSVLILVILIVAAAILFAFSFQVRETEKALVIRFGQHKRTIDTPGWCWRLPGPIDKVYKFDSRNHLYTGVMEETTTKGGETINVTSYIVWKIADPLKFLKSVHDVQGAEENLENLLRDTQNTVIGEHYFSEFVNSDVEKIRFRQIEDEMTAAAREHALREYGIELRAFGIKQLGIDEDVTKAVFERMKADRNRKTAIIKSEGTAKADKIKTDAVLIKERLLALVEAEAMAIRGAGDAEAAKYYKSLEADPELAMLLWDFETLKKILKEKSTILLTGETDLIRLLKGTPQIEPKE